MMPKPMPIKKNGTMEQTIEQARERVAQAAERDGEFQFAREVREGAWDHRDDIKAAMRGARLRGE